MERSARCLSARHIVLRAAATSALITLPVPGFPQDCTCSFVDPQWKGTGTICGCSVTMRDGRHACEVGFAAIGADTDAISEVTKENPKQYQKEVYQTTIMYLGYVHNADLLGITQPDFLMKTLPLFLRSVYLRSPVDQKMVTLDGAVQKFFTKAQCEKISKIFRNRKGAYKEQVDDVTFEVTHNGLIVTQGSRVIKTVFMPPPDQP
jgi:hypothetical protein